MKPTVPAPVIVAVWFTWSWRGFGLRYSDGRQDVFPVEQLSDKVGKAEASRLVKLATAGYGTGCWRNVPPGPGANFADSPLPPAPAAKGV